MTYTTSKGETFTSTLTDQQAADALRTSKSDFARDLVKAYDRGRLSIRQRPWLHKLAIEATQPPKPAQPREATGSFPRIVALLQTAAAKLKYPRLTLDREGQLLRLQIAGPKSKYVGSVMVTDGLPFGQNKWYGSIAPTGEFTPSRDCTPFIASSLFLLNADPAGFAAAYGKSTGSCCFCGRELSTTESTAVGYGPVCADNYGLPWGE